MRRTDRHDEDNSRFSKYGCSDHRIKRAFIHTVWAWALHLRKLFQNTPVHAAVEMDTSTHIKDILFTSLVAVQLLCTYTSSWNAFPNGVTPCQLVLTAAIRPGPSTYPASHFPSPGAAKLSPELCDDKLPKKEIWKQSRSRFTSPKNWCGSRVKFFFPVRWFKNSRWF